MDESASAQNQPEPEVANSVERHRYEISLGHGMAGFAAYVDRDGQRIFYHTVIEKQFAGRGLGATLVAAALADTRASGTRVVPVCPFVAKYLTTHHEFDDITDGVTPDTLLAVHTTGE